MKPNLKNRWVIALIDCKSNPSIMKEFFESDRARTIGYKSMFRMCRNVDFLNWYFDKNAFYSYVDGNRSWVRWVWLENYRRYRMTRKKLKKLYETTGVHKRFN